MSKEFKVVLAGDFGSGRTTYLNQFVAAKRGKSKVGTLIQTLHSSRPLGPVNPWSERDARPK